MQRKILSLILKSRVWEMVQKPSFLTFQSSATCVDRGILVVDFTMCDVTGENGQNAKNSF